VSKRHIVNNVVLAMPHPRLIEAAQDSINNLLQPEDLGRVSRYAVEASVVSPAVNVLCVAMTDEELKPLVYTE
jgi:hypothetical protein